MKYQRTITYLESFINYERLPEYPYKESIKLERIKKFLDSIGNPQDALRCVHVAGTKGKGSTCAFLTYILRAAGYRVGLYTSPHLSDFRERIRILRPQTTGHRPQDEFEGMIAKKELAGLTEKLKPSIERYNTQSKYGPLSFFEVYTALVFLYFKEKKVDFAVLETGLGGRLDATNTADALVHIITPISLEHTQQLGDTLGKIAAEKAGIIKATSSIVITAPQEKEAIKVIRKRCKNTGTKLFETGKDITYKEIKHKIEVKGLFGKYKGLRISLPGAHQIVNAATAIAGVEALRFHGVTVGSKAIEKGLRETVWPGRCEVVSKKPLIVLDGAQNTASARVLRKTIAGTFLYEKLILVVGISQDKDIDGVCAELRKIADVVITTKADNPRATDPAVVARCFKGKRVLVSASVRDARDISLSMAGLRDIILVTGSLFVVGEFRNATI